jgi:hypothetical protein
MMKMLIFDP